MASGSSRRRARSSGGDVSEDEAGGRFYLSLLLMCIIPLLFSAIISSLGQMVARHRLGRQLAVIFVVFAVGLLLAAAIGTGVGWLTGVGGDLRQSRALGELLLATESTAGASDVSGLSHADRAQARPYAELFDGEAAAVELSDPGTEAATVDSPRGFPGLLDPAGAAQPGLGGPRGELPGGALLLDSDGVGDRLRAGGRARHRLAGDRELLRRPAADRQLDRLPAAPGPGVHRRRRGGPRRPRLRAGAGQADRGQRDHNRGRHVDLRRHDLDGDRRASRRRLPGGAGAAGGRVCHLPRRAWRRSRRR